MDLSYEHTERPRQRHIESIVYMVTLKNRHPILKYQGSVIPMVILPLSLDTDAAAVADARCDHTFRLEPSKSADGFVTVIERHWVPLSVSSVTTSTCHLDVL